MGGEKKRVTRRSRPCPPEPRSASALQASETSHSRSVTAAVDDLTTKALNNRVKGDADDRARAVAAAAPHQPEQHLARALALARSVPRTNYLSEKARAGSLAALAPRLVALPANRVVLGGTDPLPG